MLISPTCEALIDLKRSMASSTGKQKLLKALEKPTMDPDYRYVLQKFLNTAEPQEQQQQQQQQQQSLVNEQENIIEDVEDVDVEEQPSFESFMRKINSYAHEAERYGVELLIKPKEESSVNDGHMKKNQQHASQTQPQPVENVLMQTPGKSVNRVVKGNVKGSSTKGKTVVKVGSGALSETDTSRNVADHRNMFKGKNVFLEIDDVVDKRINQKPGLTKKEVIKKQNERVDFTPPKVKNKVHDERDISKSATGKNVVRRNQVDQERSNQESDPRNNQLPKKLSERVEKGEAQSQKGLKKPGARTYSAMENHDAHSESTQPIRKAKEETLKRMKRVVKEENESSPEFMASSILRTRMKQLGSKSQVRSDAEGSTSKVQNVYAAKTSAMLKKYNRKSNDQERVGDDGDSSDLEILDIDEAFEGKSTPFVPMKQYSSIDLVDGSKHSGHPCVRSEYRENVLNAIKKPFDKEEYRNHQEAVQVYFITYPGLKAELVKYRYNKAKRLVILRGFFFWLQNLTQTGAFEPWTDRECLDVELES